MEVLVYLVYGDFLGKLLDYFFLVFFLPKSPSFYYKPDLVLNFQNIYESLPTPYQFPIGLKF